MYKYLLFFLLISSSAAIAQESRLADVYFNDGEYEKAASLYKTLFDKNRQIGLYFQRYTESLLNLKEYDAAEDAIRKELKLNPDDALMKISLGNVFDRKGNEAEAKKWFDEVIVDLGKRPDNINVVARTFTGMNMYAYAAAAYEKATEKSGNPKAYAFNLADLYRRLGDSEKMIHYYLLCTDQFKNNLNFLYDTFERNLSEEEIQKLQAKLYERIQAEPDEMVYNEILAWTFINQKEYKKALRQARAMDRKLNENGARVFEVSRIAKSDNDFDTAIEGFQYIIDTKNVNSSYFLSSKGELLDTKRRKVTFNYNYTSSDLKDLEGEYRSFLDFYGYNTETVGLIIEFADLEALYMNKLDTAINLLSDVIELHSVAPEIRAKAKLKLGDFYLMEENQWEATLLYSQVDKDFKEDLLGETARFSNARLSYFLGDFEWAQEQFDILKSATSRLIANDAIDLSVFIMDNLNLDTTTVPMEMFAKAELFIFQNKLNEALQVLDTVSMAYPDHSLQDDILFAKAQIAHKQLKPDLEKAYYEQIIEKYPDEIKADNAMFALASLYEFHYKDLEKAMEIYKTIFTDYNSSTFAIDARKRFRLLRGDNL